MHTIHFVINPASHSGKGLKQWNTLKEKLDCSGLSYDSYFTHSFQETVDYVSRITSALPEETDEADCYYHLAVLGGDGTVNEVINGIADRAHTCITYIPTGSGNDLARALGITSDQEDAFLRLTAPQASRRVDIGLLTADSGKASRLFAISSGIGFDAASCAMSLNSAMKKVLNRIGMGKLIYLFNAMICLFHTPPCSCTMRLDHSLTVSCTGLLFCVSMIQKYEGGGFPFCPTACATDGLFDICLISGIKKRYVSYLLPMALFGRHVSTRFVKRYRAERIELHTSVPLYVHTDGEIPGQFQDIVITKPEVPYIRFK